jgi:hypothetical protein
MVIVLMPVMAPAPHKPERNIILRSLRHLDRIGEHAAR